jgi:ATP-dependent DNA ligase
MTALVPELRSLPEGVYDGELVAFDHGIPWFPDVCARLLNGDRSIPLTFMVFDVLALDGRETMRLPYLERRRLLERSGSVRRASRLEGQQRDTPDRLAPVRRRVVPVGRGSFDAAPLEVTRRGSPR